MKCVFCGGEATVFGEFGPNCSNCYFTLKALQRGKPLQEMTEKELRTLERIYTTLVNEYNKTLKIIKNEIARRRIAKNV